MSRSRSKSQLVILDANVVIECFRNGSWRALVSNYRIVLPETIVGESIFFEDANGTRVPIDLSGYRSKSEITVVSVDAGAARAFKDKFKPTYFERLDPGELECLTYLLDPQTGDAKICSADGIVYRILGKMGRSDLGISLEELLKDVGALKKVPEQFTKKTRERWAAQGFEDL